MKDSKREVNSASGGIGAAALVAEGEAGRELMETSSFSEEGFGILSVEDEEEAIRTGMIEAEDKLEVSVGNAGEDAAEEALGVAITNGEGARGARPAAGG